MSAHCIYNTATGEAVSMAQTDEELANPLPAHLTDKIITDQEFFDWRGGWTTWNAATLSFVATGKRTVEQEEVRAANLVTMFAAMDAAIAALAPIINSVDVATIPAGTMTTAQLSNNLRTLRDAVQQHRAGLRQIATNQRHLIKYIREDLDTV